MGAIDTYKGTFTTPSSTGTDSITGVGFTPKALLLWGAPVTDENAAVNACAWSGITDGTNHYAVATASEDGVADTRRDTSETACLNILNADSDTLLAVADLDSFDSDGFTLDYSSTSSGYVVHFIAFGGSDLDVEAGATAASASPVTGLSFQPDLVFVISGCVSTPGGSDFTTTAQFGCFDGSLNQWWIGATSDSNGTGNRSSTLRTAAFCGQYAAEAMTWETAVTAINSDGFSWSGSNADRFYYLAFSTGPWGVKVGNYAKTTATAPASQDLPDLGFIPQIYGMVTASRTSTSLSNNGVAATMGAFDGTRQGLIFRTDPNNDTDADMRSNDDNVCCTGNTTGAAFSSLGVAQSISDSTPTIIWNPNDSQAELIGYWAIDEALTYELGGNTFDYNGDALGLCDCFLLKDNGDDTLSFVAYDQSDANGVFLFTGIPDNDSNYLVVAWKDTTPHVFDVTDHVLTPELSQSTDYDLYLRSDADKNETGTPDHDLRLRDADDRTSFIFSLIFGTNF
jgi:hypothetical protein